MTAISHPTPAPDFSESSIIPNSPWRVVKITEGWNDFDELLELDAYFDATVAFSAEVKRVDYGPRMFQITINADILDGPDDIPTRIGRLKAYRLHDPMVECDLEEGDLSEHFWTFDAISADAACAARDLIAAQQKVCTEFGKTLPYGGCDNLVYVDKIFVEPQFRGYGLAQAMMRELRDQLLAAPSLVFFQAMPFMSEVKASQDTPEWESEQARAIKAMTRHWLRADDLKFFQPKPRRIRELITGFWTGDIEKDYEPRSMTLWLKLDNNTSPSLDHDTSPSGEGDVISVPLTLFETALSCARHELDALKDFAEDTGLPFGAADDFARIGKIEDRITECGEGRVALSQADITMITYHADEWKMDRDIEFISAARIEH